MRGAAVGLGGSNLLVPSGGRIPVLEECARVLRPGGLILLSSAGPDTLGELRATLASAGRARAHQFADVHDIADDMLQAGFEGVVAETDRLTVDYPNVDALVEELRALGATDAGPGVPHGLGGRGLREHLRRHYPVIAGRAPASCEALYLHGWRSAPRVKDSRDVPPPKLRP